MRPSSCRSSRFSVSGRMSAKIIFAPAQRKGIRRGHEGKGGNNHFVTGLEVKQQGAHLERVRAGAGDHRLGHAQHLLQKRMAPFRVGLVAGNLADGHRPEDVFQFPPLERGLVERDLVTLVHWIWFVAVNNRLIQNRIPFMIPKLQVAAEKTALLVQSLCGPVFSLGNNCHPLCALAPIPIHRRPDQAFANPLSASFLADADEADLALPAGQVQMAGNISPRLIISRGGHPY